MDNIIYIVGIGPGNEEFFTGRAREVLEKSDVIVGYQVYVDLVKAFLPDKEYATTAMTKEIERCRLCFELAMQGKAVSMVCSGDAGVYGMASPMYEMLAEYEDIQLEVVAGITAANSGAAILGAPLNHDYCVISLSDLLTPWDIIEKRIRAAIIGDFSIAIYNPSSKKRSDYLRRACDIMLSEGADPKRACGYVENIGREGMISHVCCLEELRETTVNMFTTVFVGNSESYIWGDKLITKRGYR